MMCKKNAISRSGHRREHGIGCGRLATFFLREHGMRELHHNIRNVSTVLDILEAGAAAGQRPFLRLATDHLRLLADRLEAASPPPSAAAPVTEASHALQ